MQKSNCASCKKPIEKRPLNSFYPFCSERCRSVDLGRWLDEAYRVPDGSAEERDDELPKEMSTDAEDA